MIDEETIREINKKRELALFYYSNFEKHYLKGDLSKASEFLWGSISTLIYALGLRYGKKLGGHKEIILFFRDISDKYPELNKDNLAAAEQLHANFYHNFMDIEVFNVNKEKADKLIGILSKILNDLLKN